MGIEVSSRVSKALDGLRGSFTQSLLTDLLYTNKIEADLSSFKDEEKKLNKVPGVVATVNYATETAHVEAPAGVGVDDLVAVVPHERHRGGHLALGADWYIRWYDADGSPQNGCEYRCNPTTPPDEVCDGKDNDCDGQPDDGLGQVSCGVAQCRHTIDNCAGGFRQACDPQRPPNSDIAPEHAARRFGLHHRKLHVAEPHAAPFARPGRCDPAQPIQGLPPA